MFIQRMTSGINRNTNLVAEEGLSRENKSKYNHVWPFFQRMYHRASFSSIPAPRGLARLVCIEIATLDIKRSGDRRDQPQKLSKHMDYTSACGG